MHSTSGQPIVIDAQKHIDGLPFLEYRQAADLQRNNLELYIDGVASSQLAQQYKTPVYIYSQSAIEWAYQEYAKGFAALPDVQICYAVKACSNLAVLKLLSDMGSGFDIVSQGELARVLQVGADAKKVVFSGVGKTRADIEAALKAGIGCFNVEAISELDLINDVAGEQGVNAPISLRINPDIDAKTHPYISTGLKDNKFGIAYDDALTAYQHAFRLPHLQIVGVDCHIGSQITEVEPFLEALDRIIELIEQLKSIDIELKHIDIGGGLGVRYINEEVVSIMAFAKAITNKLSKLNLKVILEPGRSIVANAGVLLTTVDVLKPSNDKNFAIIDAAMNDLLRPALYESEMAAIPAISDADGEPKTWDIVGAVCETGDFLAKNRTLSLKVGALLAITGAGAYGFSMSSNYNSRPRAAEVMVCAKESRLIRKREIIADLWRGELF